MRVYIGPFRPANPLRHLEASYEKRRGFDVLSDEGEYTWYDKIVYGVFNKIDAAHRYITKGFTRKVKITVDDYDTWSADHTLAMIIVPILQNMRDNPYSIMNVAPEDADNLPYEEATKRVYDKMIWAFQQIIEPEDSQFFPNSDNQKLEKVEGQSYYELVPKDPSKPKASFDREGYEAYNQQIQEGLNLFAKYYRGLWT